MKKLFTFFILLLFCASFSLGQKNVISYSNKAEINPLKNKEKKEITKEVPNQPIPLGVLQGGDVIATATVISSLPYDDNGTKRDIPIIMMRFALTQDRLRRM